jgi:AcrR family transcriptional regulator
MSPRVGTADQILAAARRLFAQKGYSGTSIRDITTRARANLGAVTYHFGGKEALYHAVLADAVAPLVRLLAAQERSEVSPLARVETIMRQIFQYFEEFPDVPQLLVQQLSLSGPLPPPILRAQQQLRATLMGVVEVGQQEGAIRAGNPLLLGLSIVAQPFYLSLVRRALARGIFPEAGQPQFFDALVEHAVLFARRGLAAPVPTSTTPEGPS